jgi:deoxyribodipyrimidine photolyase
MMARAEKLVQPRGNARVRRPETLAVEGRAGGEAGRPIPSRDAGLGRLSVFVPRAADFARARNWVVPPHERVSGLSPYLRHRLVLESELIGAVWSAHPPAAVEKLVSEVLWRTYWKGWLEMRPQVWRAYLDQQRRALDGLNGPAAERLAAALRARTGIECFDAWIRELTETGYLHNHARMFPSRRRFQRTGAGRDARSGRLVQAGSAGLRLCGPGRRCPAGPVLPLYGSRRRGVPLPRKGRAGKRGGDDRAGNSE